MADDFKVQVNFKLGETLINLRGQDVSEVLEKVEEMKSGFDLIAEAMSVAKQVQMAKGLTSFTPAPAAPAASHSAPAAGATASSLRCVHGAYKDLKGKRNAKGDLYKYRYFCPGPRDNQCKAADLPGQEQQS